MRKELIQLQWCSLRTGGFKVSKLPSLDRATIEAISRVLGNTDVGLTGREIGRILEACKIDDADINQTKYIRLMNALCKACNSARSYSPVYSFILECFKPARVIENESKYDALRCSLNKTLMLIGIEVGEDGQFRAVEKAQSVNEVNQRTQNLKKRLLSDCCHAKVLACCKEEFLNEDYFHAVHEAAKSLSDAVREKTNIQADGAALFDKAFSVKDPYLAYNSLETDSQRNEQNGLKDILKGINSMIRNVTAHELRAKWIVNENDAVDVLREISLLHKYVDACTVVKTER